MLVLYLSDGYLIGMGVWLFVLGGFLRRAWYRRTQRRKAGSLVLANSGCRSACCWQSSPQLSCAFACFADFSDTFNITNVSKRWLLLHIDHERNNEGNRDRQPFTKYVAAGHKRIIFLGDSFTIGHGIKRMEDRFTDRIAAWLDEKAPGKYMVANLGRAGRRSVGGRVDCRRGDVQDAGRRQHVRLHLQPQRHRRLHAVGWPGSAGRDLHLAAQVLFVPRHVLAQLALFSLSAVSRPRTTRISIGWRPPIAARPGTDCGPSCRNCTANAKRDTPISGW